MKHAAPWGAPLTPTECSASCHICGSYEGLVLRDDQFVCRDPERCRSRVTWEKRFQRMIRGE